MSDKLLGKVKFVVPAGKATAAPPVGSSLGQRGINSQAFCTEFNKITAKYEKGTPVHTVVFIYSSGFKIKVHKTESMTSLIKKAANIDKGSQTPGKQSIGTLSIENISDIAKLKMLDSNTINLKSMCKIVMGTARSMGISVSGNLDDHIKDE